MFPMPSAGRVYGKRPPRHEQSAPIVLDISGAPASHRLLLLLTTITLLHVETVLSLNNTLKFLTSELLKRK